MGIQNNITFYKGEAVALQFTVTPVTDITGWSIRLTVRYDATDAIYLLQKDASLTAPLTGVFTITLTSAETKTTLGVGQFAYDVQRIDASSEAVLSIGTMYVNQEVYYP